MSTDLPGTEAPAPGVHPGGRSSFADRDEPALATRNRRRTRSSHELTRLFHERDDLLGVSPVADFFVESVRWSA